MNDIPPRKEETPLDRDLAKVGCVKPGFRKKDPPIEACTYTGWKPRPPLGLKPRKILNQERTIDILEACWRFAKADKKIPSTWISELKELNDRTVASQDHVAMSDEYEEEERR